MMTWITGDDHPIMQLERGYVRVYGHREINLGRCVITTEPE